MKRLFVAATFACVMSLAAFAHAQLPSTQMQSQPNGAALLASPISLLGASPDEVMQALPDAQRARPARRLASGAVAQLRQSGVHYAGLNFDETLYFLEHKLVEIELVERSPTTENGFAMLASELESGLGAPLEAGDTAFWRSGDADIALYRLFKAGQSTVRMVIRQHQERDASQL